MSYSYFLYELNKFVWLGFILALLLTYILKAGNRSYYISATVTVITTLVMLAIEPLYVAIAPDHQTFVFYFWYFTWASIDFAAAATIYQLHRRDNERIGFVATSCIVTFVLLCVTQTFRHFDVVVLRSDYMGQSFRIIINTLNLGFLIWLLDPLAKSSKRKLFGGEPT